MPPLPSRSRPDRTAGPATPLIPLCDLCVLCGPSNSREQPGALGEAALPKIPFSRHSRVSQLTSHPWLKIGYCDPLRSRRPCKGGLHLQPRSLDKLPPSRQATADRRDDDPFDPPGRRPGLQNSPAPSARPPYLSILFLPVFASFA